jgi:hypothetical protein
MSPVAIWFVLGLPASAKKELPFLGVAAAIRHDYLRLGAFDQNRTIFDDGQLDCRFFHTFLCVLSYDSAYYTNFAVHVGVLYRLEKGSPTAKLSSNGELHGCIRPCPGTMSKIIDFQEMRLCFVTE